uniref:Uncharacterized protein n=1 Tax=Arundo donax TaxID=35708 RepID=A0A0A9DWE4_ARUDO
MAAGRRTAGARSSGGGGAARHRCIRR